MQLSHELIRRIDDLEGSMVRRAKQIIGNVGFIQEEVAEEGESRDREEQEDTARRQFKLAVQAAEEAKDLEALRAFLAYQAARDKDKKNKVWGRKVQGGAEQWLFVQVVWESLEEHLRQYRDAIRQAGIDLNWNEEDPQTQLALQKVAVRFFAHLERAFRITQDRQARRFYFETAAPEGGDGNAS